MLVCEVQSEHGMKCKNEIQFGNSYFILPYHGEPNRELHQGVVVL